LTEPQRLVVVAASPAVFDSRLDRYARTAAERGHEVTVVALSRPGLPVDEVDPSGFRTLRLDVRAIDGLPAGRGLRRRLPPLGRFGRADAVLGPTTAPPSDAATAAPTSWSSPAPGGPRPRGRMRGAVDWLVARARFPLTIRGQASAAIEAAPPADVYLGMGFGAIPVAHALAKRNGGRVVYDIGDVYLEARNLARLRGPLREWLARLERGWARRADALTTANDAYADLLAKRLRAGRPVVIRNTPPRHVPASDAPGRLRRMAGLPVEARVVLYHGGLVEERGVEQLLEAIVLVRDAVLVLLGYGSLEGTIRRRVSDDGLADRVVVLPAVPPGELLDTIASADVAAMPIQPTTLNHRYTTPNKLFEAMAVGVPILASDLPGMAPIVREVDGGVLVDPTDPADIARGLRSLLELPTDARAAMRDRLLGAARDRYCWEVERETYLALLGRLTGRPW
jgi:glycosyltransferase involved in cell wall biosynthesis